MDGRCQKWVTIVLQLSYHIYVGVSKFVLGHTLTLIRRYSNQLEKDIKTGCFRCLKKISIKFYSKTCGRY